MRSSGLQPCSTDKLAVVIDREIKQCLGQMIKGVEVVGATRGGVQRLYTSHWVSQVSFEEPIVMASVSPKHDTHTLMLESGEFSVSLLAADQISEGQYFSYPAHKMKYVASEYAPDNTKIDEKETSVPAEDHIAFMHVGMKDTVMNGGFQKTARDAGCELFPVEGARGQRGNICK